MKIYLTKAGYDRLVKKREVELENLEHIREEKSIAWSSDGDGIHDNPIYHTFKDNESAQLSKLKEIDDLLANIGIVDCENRNVLEVSICSIIECEIINRKTNSVKQGYFEIVGHGESEIRKNKISYNSPIGNLLMGLKKGDIADIELPVGKMSYKIIRFLKSWKEI